jgi:hypothetical protein
MQNELLSKVIVSKVTLRGQFYLTVHGMACHLFGEFSLFYTRSMNKKVDVMVSPLTYKGYFT